MTVQPRMASAVMLLRDIPAAQCIEVFMVRRVIQSDFMPDVYVFPGGSVSQDDYAAELAHGVSAPDINHYLLMLLPVLLISTCSFF